MTFNKINKVGKPLIKSNHINKQRLKIFLIMSRDGEETGTHGSPSSLHDGALDQEENYTIRYFPELKENQR